MKTVILCGGFGTRFSEETINRPKPMIEIGSKPILWHIMNQYSNHGFQDFCLALGYRAEFIKDYFVNFYTRSSKHFSVNLATGESEMKEAVSTPWEIDLVDTGLSSMTGGRLRRLEPILREHGTFMLTYGDGVSNVDISELVKFHKQHGKLATVTAVHPPARFGYMDIQDGYVSNFEEKSKANEGWINGGFFVFEPEVFDYLESDSTILEREPLEKLANDGQLIAYKHDDFWQCMDTLRDKNLLDELWESGRAPWAAKSDVS